MTSTIRESRIRYPRISGGLRTWFAVWLTVVAVPFLVVGWLTIGLIESRLEVRVEADLSNARRLEAARISDALADYERSALSLAAGAHVIEFVDLVAAVREGRLPADTAIGGYDDFAVVDPAAHRPLDELAHRLQNKATTGASVVIDLALLGPDGTPYGMTPGMSWVPYRPEIVASTVADARPRFGNAFRSPDGSDRLGHVAPIVRDGEVVGILMVESELGPIVDLIVEHEGFGNTSEAHIAQPTPDGDAEFITLLRFERSAAFQKVVPAEAGLPINTSLRTPGGAVVQANDYRGVPSILAVQTIEETGWGLVVKIDRAEAFTPVGEVRNAILVASAITAVLVIVISAVVMSPLRRRIQRLSAAASKIADGDYRSRIDDNTDDEVGRVAASIDRLAADLERDRRLRNDAESKLRARASVDHLTGIANRHVAQMELADLAATSDSVWSVLFIDLDAFKPINDDFGHIIGDEVLRAFASRLVQAAPPTATVARWGGDEFLVVLPDTDRAAALSTVDALRAAMSAPFATSSLSPIHVGWSVGVATADRSQSQVDDIIRRADAEMLAQKVAMPDARRLGTDEERLVINALTEGRVEVHYQPVVRIDEDSTQPVGAEALVRVRVDDDLLIGPAEFLDDVIDGPVGVDLDRFVLRRALSDWSEMRRSGVLHDEFEISVNLGPASLCSSDTALYIEECLREFDVPGRVLVVEIAETATSVDGGGLHTLADLGVKVAVDDLGIAGSNFDRLADTAATYAKFDRRWLRGPGTDRLLDHLVHAVGELGAIPVAEGVEGDDDLARIRRAGVGLAQGYLFSRPVDRDRFAEFLAGCVAVDGQPVASH